ncbi:Pyrimidine dimer DNA glycosylase /DNA-(apurinic or apyrimidinic site) lyase [Thermanaerovibrio acidaminovorans DSM 6589]|uniref:Pyrimidine dimer DNA glycosylase /DNA-(Apurinic or apyrimidinic site) lyase n=1 Tax=Thermanaerovibrio acidaminovorans (strain ATCC 49978 / DSM 6589 / Su883) TaxID=525903 RepID=D1B6Q9_THEAS|nr:pyrimidine dimer DNA glycosylase/endonuclease V [Thermanaerovibrio acidaminovorans]ACZ19700.1 Pyrimidine dimer DNA glycosylase /DNA-(apurinic or apyrimidinic site) lyase [Thermanaerovibrio acidaminovorans DSM 6589]
MRLWSIHPKYLDAKGLVALWREALLARKVLSGGTVGYRNHPQLIRFKRMSHPVGAVSAYLAFVLEEARSRGYRFDPSKLGESFDSSPIPVTEGQLMYEWEHLMGKLKVRDPARWNSLRSVSRVEPHPMMEVVPGPVEDWEVT